MTSRPAPPALPTNCLAACALVALAALAGLAAAPAAAQTAISIEAGTLGAGFQVAHTFSPRFDARLGVAGWTVSGRRAAAGIEYDAQADLRTAQLFGDWHPGDSPFRLTAGLFYDATRIKGTSVPPASGLYPIGGIEVPVSLVGGLRGRVDFPALAPYAGIGWGRAAGGGHFGFTGDLGIAYQGHPSVTLTPLIPADSPVLSIPAARELLDLEIAREEKDAERRIARYDVYPVLMLGVTYRP